MRGLSRHLLYVVSLLVWSAPTTASAPPSALIRPCAWHLVPPCWTNDPSLLFVESTGTWHNFYQAPSSEGPYAPWAPPPFGSAEVWRHASTMDFVSWVDHGPLNISRGEGTGTLLASPSDPSLFLRAFAGPGGQSAKFTIKTFSGRVTAFV